MRIALVAAAALTGCWAGVGLSAGQEVVPVGDAGIAARYPGDAGIEKDPDVILLEDFEDDPKAVSWMQDGGWFDLRHGPGQGMEIVTTDPAAGRRCMQFNLQQGKQGSGAMMHRFPPTEEVYFRYYRRFAEDWEWPDGYGPHDAFLTGGKYLRPTDNDLQLLIDYWRTGDTVVRVLAQSQEALAVPREKWRQWLRDNHEWPPVGGPLLPWNVAAPEKIVPGKWHCVEAMLRLSTPGKEDGVVRLWVNGKLVCDFRNAPLRDADHPGIGIDKVFVGPYFHPGSPRDQKHWVDQIVVARKYIGPVARE